MKSTKKAKQTSKVPSKKTKTPKQPDASAKLSAEESERLVSLEATIREGLADFVNIGLALMQINDNRLYRATAETFADYCLKRWGITDRYAYRKINGAKCMLALREEFASSEDVLPINEAQIRPIYEGYDKPTDWIRAWKQVLKDTGGKEIVAERVQAVVDRMLKKPAKKHDSAKPTGESIPGRMLQKVMEVIDQALSKKRGANGQYFRSILGQLRQLIQNRTEAVKPS